MLCLFRSREETDMEAARAWFQWGMEDQLFCNVPGLQQRTPDEADGVDASRAYRIGRRVVLRELYIRHWRRRVKWRMAVLARAMEIAEAVRRRRIDAARELQQ